jgi:PleD family two-component response regulator
MKALRSNTLLVARVLIMEDSPAFRRFIRSALGEIPDLRVIAEVSDGLEAVQKAAELKPDLITKKGFVKWSSAPASSPCTTSGRADGA